MAGGCKWGTAEGTRKQVGNRGRGIRWREGARKQVGNGARAGGMHASDGGPGMRDKRMALKEQTLTSSRCL